MTLLLGCPGSGKSTLLKLLSGRLNSKHLKVCEGEQQTVCAWVRLLQDMICTRSSATATEQSLCM
jgi:ABC-type hemin transport system ATPase subunit